MTKTPKISPADLAQFGRGTEHYYRHGLIPGIVFTDGVKYIADEAGAYWLLDLIALSQKYDKRLRRHQFQVWKLVVLPDNAATLTVEDGNCDVIFTKRIECTDFPEDVTIWFSGQTMYLPVEH